MTEDKEKETKEKKKHTVTKEDVKEDMYDRRRQIYTREQNWK